MENPFLLNDKKILITGATSGIGKSTAQLMDLLGAKLILTGRSEEKLEYLKKILPNSRSHSFIALDLGMDKSWENIIEIASNLDGIVFSAGIPDNTPLGFISKTRFENVMNINYFSPTMILQGLLKKKKINKGASIVFVSSISGYLAVAKGITAYSASKGAISASIRVMALELAKKGIRINAVCPGMVKTDLNLSNPNLTEEILNADEALNYPLGYGLPSEIAPAISFLISDSGKWITGTNLVIDGGATIH